MNSVVTFFFLDSVSRFVFAGISLFESGFEDYHGDHGDHGGLGEEKIELCLEKQPRKFPYNTSLP